MTKTGKCAAEVLLVGAELSEFPGKSTRKRMKPFSVNPGDALVHQT